MHGFWCFIIVVVTQLNKLLDLSIWFFVVELCFVLLTKKFRLNFTNGKKRKKGNIMIFVSISFELNDLTHRSLKERRKKTIFFFFFFMSFLLVRLNNVSLFLLSTLHWLELFLNLFLCASFSYYHRKFTIVWFITFNINVNTYKHNTSHGSFSFVFSLLFIVPLCHIQFF